MKCHRCLISCLEIRSIVGPRPEDEVNAANYYIGEYKHILDVKPGLTSPASLYDYTHGEKYEGWRLV